MSVSIIVTLRRPQWKLWLICGTTLWQPRLPRYSHHTDQPQASASVGSNTTELVRLHRRLSSRQFSPVKDCRALKPHLNKAH